MRHTQRDLSSLSSTDLLVHSLQTEVRSQQLEGELEAEQLKPTFQYEMLSSSQVLSNPLCHTLSALALYLFI